LLRRSPFDREALRTAARNDGFTRISKIASSPLYIRHYEEDALPDDAIPNVPTDRFSWAGLYNPFSTGGRGFPQRDLGGDKRPAPDDNGKEGGEGGE